MAAARVLTWRRNFAYWCDLFSPYFIGVSALGAILLLTLRLLGRDTLLAWSVLLGGLVIGAAVSFLRIWRDRVRVHEALASLDEIARLHNRLVSAQAGVGPWPEPVAGVHDTTRWHWRRLATPVLAAAAVLFAISQAPSLPHSRTIGAVEEPMAWSQVDSWLRTLEEEKLADPPALASARDQLEQLREKPSEEWYDHNSLEAGDALRQQLEQGMREMRSAMEQSSQAVGALQKLGTTPSLSELQSTSAALQQALQGLKAGNLAAGKELQERMQHCSGSPRQMTAQQLAELQQRLADGMKSIDQCVSPRIVQGNRSGKNGEGKPKGSGGPGGGGESEPVGLNDQATQLGAERVESAANDDLSRALPGDLVAITPGSQDVDRAVPFRVQSAGDVTSKGSGGDAVWKDSLTPEESQVLERYFK